MFTFISQIQTIRRLTSAKLKPFTNDNNTSTRKDEHQLHLPTGTQYSLYTIYHHRIKWQTRCTTEGETAVSLTGLTHSLSQLW